MVTRALRRTGSENPSRTAQDAFCYQGLRLAHSQYRQRKAECPSGQVESATRPDLTGGKKDLASIANADEAMFGRSVDLDGVAVHAMAKDRGFFAKVGNNLVFVLPMADAGLSQGQTVSVEGITLAMPRHMRDKLNAPAAGDLNEDIYIYATRISR